MAYTWLGMRKMDWEEVKEIHNGTGLAGYYKLYPDQNSESVIEPGYEWEDIEHHYLCGGEFGVEVKEGKRRVAEYIKSMDVEAILQSLSCVSIKAVYPEEV